MIGLGLLDGSAVRLYLDWRLGRWQNPRSRLPGNRPDLGEKGDYRLDSGVSGGEGQISPVGLAHGTNCRARRHGSPFHSIKSVYELPSVDPWVSDSGERSSVVKRALLRLPPTLSRLSMSRKTTVSLFISESLVPQDDHGIHVCGAPGGHIAREQRDAQKQRSDRGIRRRIRRLDVKEWEVLAHVPV